MIEVTEKFKEKIFSTIDEMEKSNLLTAEISALPGFFVYSTYYVLDREGVNFLELNYKDKRYIVTML